MLDGCMKPWRKGLRIASGEGWKAKVGVRSRGEVWVYLQFSLAFVFIVCIIRSMTNTKQEGIIMTKTKLKNLLSHIANTVVYGRGKNWEIETGSEAEYEKVAKVLMAEGIAFGGFKCGHGGWVLSPNYTFSAHDACDVSSPHHY